MPKTPETTLSRARSPFLKRSFLRDLEEVTSKKRVRPQVPADAATLRAIQDHLWEIASEEWPKLFGHVIPNKLKADIDHFVGIHLLGYEFNESGKTDLDGDRWEWRTGIGTYSSDPLEPWSTDFGKAVRLATWLCPDLRLQPRIGGPRHGQIAKASFSKKHPDPALAGQPVRLPEAWPKTVRSYPAVAVLWVLLEALATEKDAAAAGEAAA